MTHKPILITNLSLSFPGKHCFEDFTTQVASGNRIAIIGRNGSGKSSLLKLLQGQLTPTSGTLKIPEDVCLGYVPQTVLEYEELSGGQRFHKALSAALATSPNLLLLDEPTNHLDSKNRHSLLHMLNRYEGTLIVITHDPELLRSCIDTIWHIDREEIHIFHGNYDDYMQDIQSKRQALDKQLSRIKQEKKSAHQSLMKEQKRAANSRKKGKKNIQQKKWPTVVSQAKAGRAEQTSGKKRAAIDTQREQLEEEYLQLKPEDSLHPSFSLTAKELGSGTLISISDASIGYKDRDPIVKSMSFSLEKGEHMAIEGKNGSGKTTLLRALLSDTRVSRTGNWLLPHRDQIAYLDQHYANLDPEKSVLNTLTDTVPHWSIVDCRHHLGRFLFRTDLQVRTPVKLLSGGEKAKLSLALIAAYTPALLVLDEITNNLDLETKAHVTQILAQYPGSLIVVSHDKIFLEDIRIDQWYTLS